jgi:hypothetical protein
MRTYYVAVDIGCIECGESTAVLGIFTHEKDAEAAAAAADAILERVTPKTS